MSFVGYLDKMKLYTGHGGDAAASDGLHPDPDSIMVRRESSCIVQAPSVSEMDIADDSTMHDLDDSNHGNEDEDTDVDDREPEYFFAEDEEEFDEQTLMEKEHWSRGQLDLFTKVRSRGSYPIFPANWMLDFSNIPDQLFVQPNEDAIIGALNKNQEHRGYLKFSLSLFFFFFLFFLYC